MPTERIPIISREQWLTLRQSFITASDVPSICDVGYRSPLAVYAEKTGLALPPEENDVMRRGRWMEPAVFTALSEEYPTWEIRRAKVFLADKERRLGATPDGVFFDPDRPQSLGLVQTKVVSRPVFHRDWLDDPDNWREDRDAPAHVPTGYQLQTITEAMLAEADRPIVAALVLDTFGAFLRVFDVPRHAPAESTIVERVKEWWLHVDHGAMPPVDPERDAEIIKTLYPVDDGTEIDLSGDNEILSLVDQRDTTKHVMKADAETVERIDTAIKAKLGAHSYARLSDGRVISWKSQERKAYSVDATSYRVLRVSKPK